MRTPLPKALAQETTDTKVVDILNAATSSVQPSIQSGNQPKLKPDARRLVTLRFNERDISPDERSQRA
jgi:hypothetical protein